MKTSIQLSHATIMDRICIAIWSLNKQKPPTQVTVNLNTSSTTAANSNANKVKQPTVCQDSGNITFPTLFIPLQQSAVRVVLSEANDDPTATAEDSKLLANSSAHSRQAC